MREYNDNLLGFRKSTETKARKWQPKISSCQGRQKTGGKIKLKDFAWTKLSANIRQKWKTILKAFCFETILYMFEEIFCLNSSAAFHFFLSPSLLHPRLYWKLKSFCTSFSSLSGTFNYFVYIVCQVANSTF